MKTRRMESAGRDGLRRFCDVLARIASRNLRGAHPEAVASQDEEPRRTTSETRLCLVVRTDKPNRFGNPWVDPGQKIRCTTDGTYVFGSKRKRETSPQWFWQPPRGECTVPLRRSDPGADAGKNRLAPGAGAVVYGQQRRGHHFSRIGDQVRPGCGQACVGYAAERGHSVALGIVAVAFRDAEWGKNELVRQNGTFDQSGEDPFQGAYLIGLVVLPDRVNANCGGELALNASVPAIELAGGEQCLFAGAEEHGVDHAKGRVKAADGVVHKVRVVYQGRSHPGVRQLQERGTPSAEKHGTLAVHLPSDGIRAEEAIDRTAGHRGQIALQRPQIGCRYEMRVARHKA